LPEEPSIAGSALSAEEIKVYERRWFDAMNKGKAAVMTIGQDFAHIFVFYSPLGTDLSFEGLKQFFSELYDAFPDQHYTLDDVVVEGDLDFLLVSKESPFIPFRLLPWL
jgi:hypothetical protein